VGTVPLPVAVQPVAAIPRGAFYLSRSVADESRELALSRSRARVGTRRASGFHVPTSAQCTSGIPWYRFTRFCRYSRALAGRSRDSSATLGQVERAAGIAADWLNGDWERYGFHEPDQVPARTARSLRASRACRPGLNDDSASSRDAIGRGTWYRPALERISWREVPPRSKRRSTVAAWTANTRFLGIIAIEHAGYSPSDLLATAGIVFFVAFAVSPGGGTRRRTRSTLRAGTSGSPYAACRASRSFVCGRPCVRDPKFDRRIRNGEMK